MITNTAEPNLAIGRRQLYILPSRVGWYFVLILLALFGIAVKYDNQAAFMMLFILVGLGNAAMLATHNNVIHLVLTAMPPSSVFAGQDIAFKVRVENPSDKPRQGLYLACAEWRMRFDLPAASSQVVCINLPSQARGVFSLPAVNLCSHYPVNLFFCWSKRLQTEHTVVVYPTPHELIDHQSFTQADDSEPDRKQPELHEPQTRAAASKQGDLGGLRPYQVGDRLRDVHWPALAKTQSLAVKEYETIDSDQLHFNWSNLPPAMDIEAKLSQLCAWVLAADQAQQSYSLTTPIGQVAMGSGAQHRQQCLRVLAEHPQTDQVERTNRQTRKFASNWFKRLTS